MHNLDGLVEAIAIYTPFLWLTFFGAYLFVYSAFAAAKKVVAKFSKKV